MVHLAVQQLHAHGDAVLLGERRDAAESGRAGGDRLGIGGTAAVPEHRDHVGDTVPRRLRDRRLKLAQQLRVVGRVVEAGGDEVAAVGGIAHRAHQPEFAHPLPVVGLEEIDPREAHGRPGPTQVRERNRLERPPAHGLLETAG